MHELLEKAKAAGWKPEEAAVLLSDAKRFGQVIFTSGSDAVEEEKARKVRILREALIKNVTMECGVSGVAARTSDHRRKAVAVLLGRDTEDFKYDQESKMSFLKDVMNRDRYGIQNICGDGDASETPDFVMGMDASDTMRLFEGKGWEDVEASCRMQAKQNMGRDWGSMEPAEVESELSERGRALCKRFGLGSIRVSGLPSIDEAQSALDTLEAGLTLLAQRTGLAESSVGMGTLSVNLSADVGFASAYASMFDGRPGLCLSADNGPATLAHEWFHAFDMNVGLKTGLDDQTGLSEAAEGGAGVDANAETARRKHGELFAAMDKILHTLRKGDAEKIQKELEESRDETVKRCVKGVFDRFYAKRCPADTVKRARSDFADLYGMILDGTAGKKELAEWREDALGDKAAQCRHYDAFVMAEAGMRKESLKSDGKSMMQTFAEYADKQLSKMDTDFGAGYSTSAIEMTARGFEGNLFDGLSKEDRRGLTDGRDNSMYWPVGSERGAAAESYKKFLSAGEDLLVRLGDIPAPNLGEISGIGVKDRLEKRKEGQSVKPEFNKPQIIGC